MGKRRLYDEDVHEVFDTFGVEVAIYFEAIRYRQQLTPGELFPFNREDIKEKIDLSFKQQRRVREILTTTGWIETAKKRDRFGGTVSHFRVTDFASEFIKHTPRRRDVRSLFKQLHKKMA